MEDFLSKLIRFPSKLQHYLFDKYLVWSINIILLGLMIYTSFDTNKPVFLFLIVYFIFSPLILVLRPKLLFSRNILFLAVFTYFSIPLCINFFIGAFLKFSIPQFLIFIFFTSISFFILLYFKNVKLHRREFLDHSKIALDIVRLIFVITLTLSAVYGKLIDDFSALSELIPLFRNNTTIDELRNYFQLTFQIVAIPFVFSSTLLRIIIDWLLLKK